MKENIALLNFIRSNKFILYVAMFTVVFLTPNTYFVYYQLSVFINPYREIASGGVSLIVAASIMIYTLRKNYKMAKYYAWFEVLISGYYYAMTIGWSWALIPAIGFTLILPISVSNYTKEIDVDIDMNDPEMAKWLEQNPHKRPTDYYLLKKA